MTDQDKASLTVEGLSYAYGLHKALDDVSFSVPPGCFAVVLGPNGAGKTTLFSIITRLFQSHGGRIRIMGYDLQRESGRALRRLGVVFQTRTLDLDLSVRQNLSYHASLHGFSRQEAQKRIKDVLQAVDLSERSGDAVRNLSGGQMRRVEIARALLHKPSVMLLDEASIGLDVRSRLAIQAIIRDLIAKQGLTVLWATHLIDEVMPDDYVMVLNRGRLAAHGTSVELQAKTATDTIQQAFVQITQEREREIKNPPTDETAAGATA